MSRFLCSSLLQCGEKLRVIDDNRLRQGCSVFEANLFTLVGPLRLHNLAVGPVNGASIRLEDVQGGRGELNGDGMSSRISTVEVMPPPEWWHGESAQIESGVEEAVQSFTDRRGSIVRLNDLIEIVDTDERQLIHDKFDVPDGCPGPGKPKGTDH